MKQCPFCFGEVADEAQKCRHCGEWIVQRSAGQPPFPQSPNDLGRVADKYVNYQIVMGIVGLVVFLLIFFLVFLPAENRGNRPLNVTPTLRNFGSP